jgi:glycosyltransferase involved in cell wall biosynthesis/O-antigen/teichoic acid export membrane protein
MHILVLTDRDWTHPQGGGTGTNLFGQISRWLAWGHRVTVVASSYPGAPAEERIDNLTIHRMGGRGTVFPRAIWKLRRGLVPDADVVLEVVNGITFLTPLWLRLPRLALIHHVHREHYAQELGRLGKVAAFLLETAPLRWLYAGSRFQTLSHAEAEKIAEHGIALDQIDVNYIGVESGVFEPGGRAPEPTLLYLGRLKRYKRIELLLDALEAIPGAVLEIAGEGDHRPELEEEIERRGLGERVRMHGHVSEERKAELFRRAWVNLTASSAEGWCLTVMEAAACGTPSVALAVGGLPESIDDGRTGLLAHDEHELPEKVRAVVDDPAERERLGANALERARSFTWDAAARRTLDALGELRTSTAEMPSLRTQLASSDTGRAAGLAGAVMAGNVVALVFTIAFARILGTSGYGTLAALVSTFLILQVPGSALQITVARDVSSAIALGHEAPGAGVRRWMSRVVIVTVAVTAVAILLREQIAAAIGVDAEWAAAATLPTGCLWLLASIERGALQGFQRYRAVGLSLVGEAIARLGFGLLLVALGLGVTGAFLGTALSVLGMTLLLAIPLRRELARTASLTAPAVDRFRDLVGRAWAPVAGLALLLTLQEIHVIVVKHEASDDAAGAYAAAAVAAKAIIWVAVGLGLYLLPEAARRTKSGVDARPVLIRTLALIGALALPMVLVYAVAARPLLETVFGESFGPAAGALPWLAVAMALLACAYLAVQYLLALGKAAFIVVLGIAAAAEPLLLLVIGAQLRDIALALFGLQLALAVAVVAISFRSAAHPAARPGPLTV